MTPTEQLAKLLEESGAQVVLPNATVREAFAVLEAEVARLTREREAARAALQDQRCHCASCAPANWPETNGPRCELSREVEELRADRERLNWMEGYDISVNAVNDIVNGLRWDGKYYGNIRKALDAARKVGAEDYESGRD